MKQAMHLHVASSELTKSFEAGNIPTVTATAKSNSVVVRYEDYAQPPVKTPAKHQSIADLMAELESDADFRDDIQQARAWVADEFYAEDGDTLRTLRLRRGWSQAQLAEKLATSQSHVAKIERGKENLHISTCRKLCKVFDIEMNVLNILLQRQEAIFAEKQK